MRFRVSHRTIYQYSEPVTLCHNKAHLTPREHPFQRLISTRFLVDPPPAVFRQRDDFFGNRTTFFTVQQHHTQLTATVISEVEVGAKDYPDLSESYRWEFVRDLLRADLSTNSLEAFEFVFDSPHIRRSQDLARYALPSFPRGRPILEGVWSLMERIHKDFEFSPRSTTVSTPLPEVLRIRKGVCQDFAHLMVGCLRSIGLSARYVSGYLRTIPPPGKPRLVGADASHAWVSVALPGVGWFDFDPTNNKVPAGDYITLAWGRDYSDVSPLRGTILGGGRQLVSVAVDVLPLDEEGSPAAEDGFLQAREA